MERQLRFRCAGRQRQPAGRCRIQPRYRRRTADERDWAVAEFPRALGTVGRCDHRAAGHAAAPDRYGPGTGAAGHPTADGRRGSTHARGRPPAAAGATRRARSPRRRDVVRHPLRDVLAGASGVGAVGRRGGERRSRHRSRPRGARGRAYAFHRGGGGHRRLRRCDLDGIHAQSCGRGTRQHLGDRHGLCAHRGGRVLGGWADHVGRVVHPRGACGRSAPRSTATPAGGQLLPPGGGRDLRPAGHRGREEPRAGADVGGPHRHPVRALATGEARVDRSRTAVRGAQPTPVDPHRRVQHRA